MNRRATVAVLLTVALGVLVPVAPASAQTDPTGGVIVIPGSGNDPDTVRLRTPAGCPAEANAFYAMMRSRGFPPDGHVTMLLTARTLAPNSEVWMAGRGVPIVVAVLIGKWMAAGCGTDGDAAGPLPIPASEPSVRTAPGPVANPAPIAASAGEGTVLGNVVRDAGRDPRSGTGREATGSAPVGGDPVQVRAEGGEVVARAVTSSDGAFELALPPGNYLVSEDIAGVSQRVQVTAGVITTLTLLVPGA